MKTSEIRSVYLKELQGVWKVITTSGYEREKKTNLITGKLWVYRWRVQISQTKRFEEESVRKGPVGSVLTLGVCTNSPGLQRTHFLNIDETKNRIGITGLTTVFVFIYR